MSSGQVTVARSCCSSGAAEFTCVRSGARTGTAWATVNPPWTSMTPNADPGPAAPPPAAHAAPASRLAGEAEGGEMEEREWLACSDPRPMLKFWHRQAGDRKRRLFVCALCRGAWERLADSRCRRAVEVAERFAEGAEEEL